MHIKEKRNKLFAVIMAVILILSFCACGAQKNPENQDPGNDPVNTEPSDDPKTEPEKEGTLYAVPIMYHLIMEDPYSPYTGLFVRPGDFDAQLEAFAKAGYQFVFADEYELTEKPSVVITFDDGYEDNYTTMFPILQKYNAKATVFLIGNYIDDPGYLTETNIKEMSESGLVHFGCHTSTHCELSKKNAEQTRKEFADCVEKVESVTGKKCRSLAYPYGDFNESTKKIAAEFFDYCYTTEGTLAGKPDVFEIPRVNADRELKTAKMLDLVKKLYKELNR